MAELPIIVLAFANEQEGRRYLRNLPEELRQLQDILKEAERNGLCRLELLPNASLDQIFDVFTRNRDQVSILHYAGHADSGRLLLESTAAGGALAHTAGLATFLGQCGGLQLVFLNGCSTRAQVARLLEAGVAAVIATARAIDDGMARAFAIAFYTELAAGFPLRAAYEKARGRVLAAHDTVPEAYYGHRDLGTTSEPASPDPSDDNGFPWEFRPGTELVERWSLPDAAGNPEFGLPDLPQRDLPECPFRHMNWFTAEHAEVFFGRGYQVRELYEQITHSSSPPILLLYGASGVGKSSLLGAGLVPRLETCGDVVRYCRRDQQKGLSGTLRDALQLTGDRTALNEGWRAEEARLGKPLFVFLDQVEEVFTRPDTAQPQELDEFLAALGAALGNRDARPRGKLVLGFRKEWLAELDRRLAEAKLPRANVFLRPLDRRGIIEAIRGPSRPGRLQRQYRIAIEDGLPEVIADDLLADAGSALAPTLQVLLTKMWERARQANRDQPRFDRSLYEALKAEGYLLKDVIDDGLKVIGGWNPAVEESGLALDVLTYHTTDLGTAAQHTRAELSMQYAHQAETLEGLLGQCKDQYLIIEVEPNPDSPTRSTRLAHDLLAPLVQQRFRLSIAAGQRARRLLENRAPEWRDGKTGPVLDGADLASVEDGARGMRVWTTDETRLVDASRRAEEQREAEEQQRARQLQEAEERQRQAEADKQRETEQRLQYQEESNRRLRKRAVALLMSLAVTAIVAVFASYEWRQAGYQRRQARYQQHLAEDQKTVADEQKEIAVGQTEIAVKQKAFAEANLNRARQVVDNFYNKVSENKLFDVPGLQPLRKELLEAALPYYQDFLKQRGDDPQLRLEMAAAYFRVARINEAIGNEHEVLEAYRKSIPIREALVQEQPDDADYQSDLAWTYNNMACVLSSGSRAAEAEPWHRKAMAIREQLVRKYRSSPMHHKYQYELSYSYYNLGDIEAGRAHLDLAEKFLRQALEIREEQVRTHAENGDYRAALAWSDFKLATVLDSGGDKTPVIELLKKCLAIRETLVKDFPKVIEYQNDLAAVYLNLGAQYQLTAQTALALDAYRKAIPLLEKLAAANPSVADYQRNLAIGHNEIGLTHLLLGQTPQGVEEFRNSLRTYEKLAREHPDNHGYRNSLVKGRQSLAGAYLLLGRFDECEATWKESLDMLEQLIKEDPSFVGFRADVVSTLQYRAFTYLRAGLNEKALTGFEQCLLAARQLVRDHPSVRDYQGSLAYACMGVAAAYQANNKPDQCLAFFQEALGIYENLARLEPNSVFNKCGLVGCMMGLSTYYSGKGDFAKSLEWNQKELPLLESLADAVPESNLVTEQLPGAYKSAGVALMTMGRVKDAADFYQKVRPSLEKLARDPSATADMREALAFCLVSLGTYYEGNGKPGEANAAFREALPIYEGLLGAQPDEPGFLFGAAKCLCSLAASSQREGRADRAGDELKRATTFFVKSRFEDLNITAISLIQVNVPILGLTLGWMNQDSGRTPDALLVYDKALSAAAAIERMIPLDAQTKAAFARIQYLRSISLESSGQPDQAEVECRQVIATLEGLIQGAPGDENLNNLLALGHSTLAEFVRVRGRNADAEASCRKAVVILAKLDAGHPDNLYCRLQLSNAHNTLGLIDQAEGRLDRARKNFEAATDWAAKSIQTLESLPKQTSPPDDIRQALLQAYWARAWVRRRLNRLREALGDWERAIELDDGRNRDVIKASHAEILVRIGELDHGLAEVESLGSAETIPGSIAYVKACVFSLSSTAVLKDEKLPPTEKQKRNEQFALRAIEQLSKASKMGLFKDLVQLDNMLKETDFDPLRHRKDFQRLLADIMDKKAGPR